jgi:hypothetical protein
MHCMTARCNVRKSLLCNILVAVALPWLVLGCGGGPTAPGAAPTAQSDAAVATPAPTPVPTPAPPTPVPAPSPTPPPVPSPPPSAASWTFDGSTSQSHWYGQPVLPDHFDLVIGDGFVQAGGHSFPIQSQAPGNVSVIAGTRNVETLTLEYNGAEDGSGSWRWTYNGLPGQAAGTLSRRQAPAE